MKKKTSLVLAALIAILCVTGCGGSDSSDSSKQESSSEQSVTTTAEKTPEESTDDSSAPDDEFKIPDSAEKNHIKGLYKVGNCLTDYNDSVYINYVNNEIQIDYVTSGLDEMNVKSVRYSIAQDKILSSAQLPENSGLPQLIDNGGFCTVSFEQPVVTFYDSSLKQTSQTDLSEYADAIGSGYISRNGKYLLYSALDDSGMHLYDFEEGSDTIVGKPFTYYYAGQSDNNFYLSESDNNIICLNSKTKTSEKVFKSFGETNIRDGYSYCRAQNYFSIQSLSRLTEQKMTKLNDVNECEWIYSCSDTGFLTVNQSEIRAEVRAYDIQASTVTEPFILDDCAFYSAYCDNGIYFFAVCKDYAKFDYYLFDTNEAAKSDIDILPADFETLSGITYPELSGSAETIAIEQELLDDYGVRVIFKEEDLSPLNIGYEYSPVNEKTVAAKLQAIKDVLDYFPDGMIREIENGSELWLYMVTDLHSDNEDGSVSSYGGCATSLGGIRMITMDADVHDEFFKTSLSHEISHLLDYIIDFRQINTGWVNLLPEDVRADGYLSSYQAGYDNKYTPYDDGRSEIWFYDNYSRTFPTEDRAVIFQILYDSYINGKLDFNMNENLLRKARYYAVIIRQNFVSCKNSDTLPWEKYLGEIDMHEFDDIPLE